MTDASTTANRLPLVLGPGERRTSSMGRVSAVCKADGAETGARYSISEWSRSAHEEPGRPLASEDDVFFVLDGTMSLLWATSGSAPGDFEERMPPIADWFRARSDADADC